MSSHRRIRLVALLAAALIVLAIVFVIGGDEGAAGASVLPDLTMSPPTDVTVEAGADGGHVLRFTAIMNNLGAGDVIIDGARHEGAWRLTQRIARTEEGHTTRPIPTNLVWGGDGHDHWHVLGAARYRLEGLDEPIDGDRFDHKVGFCIFDSVPQATDLPGSPGTVFYGADGCGLEGDDVVFMGLSVGWGDRYRSTLPGQWIDITDLPEGRYRLIAEVDPDGLFAESDIANNEAWVDLELVLVDGSPSLRELGRS